MTAIARDLLQSSWACNISTKNQAAQNSNAMPTNSLVRIVLYINIDGDSPNSNAANNARPRFETRSDRRYRGITASEHASAFKY